MLPHAKHSSPRGTHPFHATQTTSPFVINSHGRFDELADPVVQYLIVHLGDHIKQKYTGKKGMGG